MASTAAAKKNAAAKETATATETGGYLSREAILEADDLGFADVDVPEWGGKVRIRALSGTERDKFEASIAGNGKRIRLDNVRAKLVQACAVDVEGNPLFGTADVVALGRKSAAGLDRVFEACKKLSGLSEEDVDELVGE
jgi:hypothetical protein